MFIHNKERVKALETQLQNKLDTYRKLNSGLKQRSLSASLQYDDNTIEVRGTLRERVIKSLDLEIRDLELALVIIRTGFKATNEEILDRMMSDYCESNFKCGKNSDCENFDYPRHSALDCPNCGCNRTCEECSHREECPYVYDYDKKMYAKKAIQDKALKYCIEFSETAWGDTGYGDIECKNCVNPCLYRKVKDLFVFEQSSLEKLNEGSINKVKNMLMAQLDESIMMTHEMDLGL